MSANPPTPVKPNPKAIQAYYDALSALAGQDLAHEMGLRQAFQNLLTDTGKQKSWTFVAEQSIKVRGRQIRPDGMLRDEWKLPRGYWEAKDTADDLERRDPPQGQQGLPAGQHDLRGHPERRPVPARLRGASWRHQGSSGSR